jgi:hypothetical protein
MPRNVAVLLTATIAPGAVPYLKRADPAVRRADYAKALHFWLATRAASAVVFCDNSGAAIDDFAAAARARPNAEVLSFGGLENAATRGKGYGELGILRYALEHSAALANADAIMKVTGRLIVRNAETLVTRLGAADADVLCDLRRNLQVADARVFCATPAFLRNYLLPRAEEIDDLAGNTFEVVLARAVHRALSEGGRWAMLPAAPDLDGVAATADEPYGRSAPARWKRALFRRWKERMLSR